MKALFSGLCARLILLVLLGAIPLFILLTYTGFEHRSHEENDVRQQATSLVLMAVDEHQQLVVETRLLLSVLSKIPHILDPSYTACNQLMRSMVPDRASYANIGVTDMNGDVYCSSVPLTEPVNVKDRAYFRRALENRGFAIGDYQVGRIINKQVLVFSYPVFDDQARFKAMLFASVTLDWLGRGVITNPQLAGSTIDIIDHSTHTLLASYPTSTSGAGSSLENSALIDAIHGIDDSGTANVTGPDGIIRLTIFKLLKKIPTEKRIYVAVGVPLTTAYAEANAILERNLAILFIVVSLILLLAWYSGNVLILTPVRSLLMAARRLASGDLTARIPASSALDEISVLGHEFNNMAGALQQKADETRHAEQLLRQREEQFRNVIETVPDILYTATVTDDYDALFVSPALTRLLGYTPDEFVGEPGSWASAIHEEDRQSVLAQVQSAVESGADDYTIEYRIRHKDGETLLWFEDRARITRDVTGRATIIHGIMSDITEHKKIQQAILDSENRFRSITAMAQDAVLLIDDEENLIYWNPAAVCIFGYTQSEALGQNVHQLLAPERYHQASTQGFSKYASTGEGSGIGKTMEVEARHKNGHEFPVELSLSALQLEGKWHALGILRDISERRQHEEQLRRTNRALGAIHASNYLLTRSGDVQELLDGVCRSIIEHAGYRFAWVALRDDETGAINPLAWAGNAPDYIDTLRNMQSPAGLTECPATVVIRSGETFIENDIKRATDRHCWHEEAVKHDFSSVIALPVMRGKETAGALVIYSTEINSFSQDEIALLQELTDDLGYGINALQIKLKHTQIEKQIAYQALHDGMTGLPNRTMIIQSLDNAINRVNGDKGAIAILFLNFDEFKLVNDTYGQAAGDALLVQAAERLAGIVRDRDIIARPGGDEFIVILERFTILGPETTIAQEATIVAQRILDELQSPFQINGQHTYVSASIGISLYPGDAGDASQLIQLADSAMYRAKQLGRANYQFYSKELTEYQKKRMSLATLLHQAIEKQEFVLHYQPIIDMTSNLMVGVEALIRWEHEKGKLISPADFLPVAEDTGLILPVGEWVIREACRQISVWSDNDIVLTTAVNISARQMWHGDVASLVLAVISETGISRDLLELEITESAMIIDHEKMENIIEQFKYSNIKIALDDFGTGYSSLNRLKHLPFYKLKIDKSFVDGLPDDKDNMAIVTATVQMARSLGLYSLAEGVETIEQYNCLKNLGCDFAQGYYFSRPVPAKQIERIYEHEHPE